VQTADGIIATRLNVCNTFSVCESSTVRPAVWTAESKWRLLYMSSWQFVTMRSDWNSCSMRNNCWRTSV